ncbi:MAG: glycosyltransferase family 39 protein [Phycisphaerae bacterium]|nr:glycosyltransferase family 39 protein [Phycisphaerae bacterium]
MTDPTAIDGPRFAPWAGSWRAVLLLTLAVTAARVAYLVLLCPYSLIEDEAQYWVWSLHPDWAYSTKGPGVAWAIGLATQVLGDAEWAVRLPAALAGGVAMLAVAGLARDTIPDRRAAFFAAACMGLAPVFQALSLLMTIDGPLVACWALACWSAWRALAMGSKRAWVALGLVLAVGVLFKFTIVLLVPGIVLAWALRRRAWRAWPTGVVLAHALLMLGVAPPILWNARHGWPTLAHLLGHAGLPGSDLAPTAEPGYSPLWTLSLLGAQLALVGPALALMWVGWRGRRETAGPGPASGTLLHLSLPVLLFYLGLSFLSEPEGNWPVAGWVAPMPLAGWGAVHGMDRFKRRLRDWLALPAPRPRAGLLRRRPETIPQVAWHATLAVGIAVAIVVARLDLILGLPIVSSAVPAGRLTGLTRVPRLAAHVRTLADGTGSDPIVIAQHYGRAAQLWYYLHRSRRPGDGPVTVYCASRPLGGRKTPWDFWPDTDLADPALLGRAAVISADEPGTPGEAHLRRAFESLQHAGRLDGDPKRRRAAYLGVGYRGFTDAP